MLRSKIRVKSLTPVLLFALVGVCSSLPFLGMNAQEPAKNDAKIKDLQKERLLIVREAAKKEMQHFKAGIGRGEEVVDSTRVLMDAELDVCESNKERIAALEGILAAAKENETMIKQFADSRQGREGIALLARAERLRVEIALERAKANK
jgi:hypothetical protein